MHIASFYAWQYMKEIRKNAMSEGSYGVSEHATTGANMCLWPKKNQRKINHLQTG